MLPYNERVGALDGLAFVSFKLGQILIGQDKPHDALPRIERAFDTVHRLQHLRGVVAIGDVYFKLLMRLGELARASEVARSVAAAAKSLSSG